MKSEEHWQQVKTFFNAAIEQPPSQRKSYLAEVCDDEELCREVEVLLEQHEVNNSSLEVPLLRQEGTEHFAGGQQTHLPAGTQINRYRLDHLIGKGGMGEVYLAEDTRLKRLVALKILSADLARSPALVNRFWQEARAASALNHPNILTVYEIGQSGMNTHYIAAEFIDGVTLKQLLTKKQLTLNETIEIARQMLSALNAAHQAGIVHRDIKAQNIMLRRDGLVKVLDFGIAKFLSKSSPAVNPDSSLITEPGIILGTAKYMSPEQARGLPLDARSDLWSVGVTMYEMITGELPFSGETTSDVIASILEREPLPVTQFARRVPVELEQIVKRCLSKDLALRYQSAAELTDDLENLQQTQFPPDTITPSKIAAAAKTAADLDYRSETTDWMNRSTLIDNQILKRSPKLFSPQHVLNPTKRWIAAVMLLLGAIFAIVVSRTTVFNRFDQWSKLISGEQPFRLDKITRLTTTGNVVYASVSANGNYLAYVIQESEQQSLWIKQVATATPKLLLPTSGNLYRGLTFSLDNNFVYYVIHEKAKGMSVLYQIPVLGGDSRPVIEDVDSPVTFSPDNQNLAFVRGFTDAGVRAHALITANLDGTNQKIVAVHKSPDFFSREGPAWSPDGKSIAIAATKATHEPIKFMYLIEINVADGSERAISAARWDEIGRLTWLKNNSIVMTAIEQKSNRPRIVQISSLDGSTEPVTRDTGSYRLVSATSDGQTLVAVQSDRVSHVWTAPSKNLRQIKRITAGVGRYYQTSWTPDNKIIYVSEESGNQDVWTMAADGSSQKQLTFDSAIDYYPKVTPDNRYIVFASNREGIFHLYRMDRDGSNLLKLTTGGGENYPDISADNQTIYFTAADSGKSFLSKISIDGGNSIRLLDYQATGGTVSPDGKRILCLFLDEKSNLKWQLGIFSLADNQLLQRLDIPTENQLQFARWAGGDSETISYINTSNGVDNIWSLIVSGGQKKQLTQFDSSDQIFYYDWSSDNNRLVCLRGLRISDAVSLSTPTNLH